ncbi:MAG: nitroreductase family protein [Candidatus Aenigmarchaeota archaeon]|nr:nitroreductase family protein [Candidatus Aenigmarchaeota archaeon]MDW8159897.1 nitroreductase family protein [Candidatus Aenigmarchaeota archaeon]
MNVFEAIAKRRSIRKYKKKDVDDNQIGVLLWAACQAPSAGNLREWRYIVVRDKKTKEILYKASFEQEQVKEAPVLIVVCADVEIQAMRYGTRGELVYSLEDCAAAIENMLLAATALGLGTCWVGAFDEEMVRLAVNLPNNIRPIAIITVGYPDEKVESRENDYSRFCFLEKYGNRYEFEIKTIDRILREKIEEFKEKQNLKLKQNK